MSAWDNLSIRDKAEMMRVAIGNGITNINDIKREYNEFAEGGSIHIKPSHRGRLTELKERTGKTEAELYNDGNPAHKKMVVFARNARKWHDLGGRLLDTGGPRQNPYTEIPSSTYVSKPTVFEDLIISNSPKEVLKRANHVYSNYSAAKDNPLTPAQEAFYNTLRWFQDRGLNPVGSGVSNCTLTATQWVDPDNPVKNASSIYYTPDKYNYSRIEEKDAIPGNIVIAKDPDRESYHTMLINGFAKDDGVYNLDGKNLRYKKGEPLLTYSRGGHDDSFIRRNIPLSVYTANSDGHTDNTFYRYNYPNDIVLPEVVITPKAFGGKLYDDGGEKQSLHPNVGRAIQYFVDRGLTDYQAAGLVGNLMRESSMDPGAVNKDSQAYGLAQWLGDRKKNLHGRYGNNPTFDQQLAYIWDELNSTHKRGLRALKASKSADEAARNAMGYYEFSAGPEKAIAAMNSHGQNGEDAMRKGILFANDIMGTIAGPARYNPQDSLPPNFQVPENWELLYRPQYPLDELQATGTFMPAEEVPLDSLMPTPQSRRAKALDVLRQYEYLSSLLSQ